MEIKVFKNEDGVYKLVVRDYVYYVIYRPNGGRVPFWLSNVPDKFIKRIGMSGCVTIDGLDDSGIHVSTGGYIYGEKIFVKFPKTIEEYELTEFNEVENPEAVFISLITQFKFELIELYPKLGITLDLVEPVYKIFKRGRVLYCKDGFCVQDIPYSFKIGVYFDYNDKPVFTIPKVSFSLCLVNTDFENSVPVVKISVKNYEVIYSEFMDRKTLYIIKDKIYGWEKYKDYTHPRCVIDSKAHTLTELLKYRLGDVCFRKVHKFENEYAIHNSFESVEEFHLKD